MLLNLSKIFSSSSSSKTGILFYCTKGSGSKTIGDSGSDKKETKANICDVCQAQPCECNPSAPTAYECRKYGHNLPSNSVQPPFENVPNLPTGVFRCTAGEVLGKGANKGSCYQNPEYFSYQHMTFYDIHLVLRPYRSPSAKTGRKK